MNKHRAEKTITSKTESSLIRENSNGIKSLFRKNTSIRLYFLKAFKSLKHTEIIFDDNDIKCTIEKVFPLLNVFRVTIQTSEKFISFGLFKGTDDRLFKVIETPREKSHNAHFYKPVTSIDELSGILKKISTPKNSNT